MTAGSAAKLEAIRRGLTSAAESSWKKLVATTAGPHGAVVNASRAASSPPTTGTSFALDRVDPSRQCGEEGARFIVHAQGGVAWALRMDAELNALIRRARELQATFGFPHRGSWDVVATFDSFASDVGERALGHEEGVAILRPLAISIRDQLVLDPQSAEVPGLAAATKGLAALHAPLKIPAGAAPKDLLPSLFATLELNCWPLFSDFWVTGTTLLDLHFRWDEFRQGWAACGGAIEFTRYDAEPAADAVDGDRVKLFVTRTDGHEHTWTRPLTFRRDAGEWRLEAGIL